MGEVIKGSGFRQLMKHQNQPQRIEIRIDPEKDKPIECECGSVIFDSALRIYKISAVNPQNPTGTELISHQQIFVCRQCGKPL